METAWLLEVGSLAAVRLEGIERPRFVGEEPEGIEVRTGDAMPGDDLVGTWPTQPQGPGSMSDVIGRLSVHHRPFVQTEAAEMTLSACRGGQHTLKRLDRGACLGDQRLH